jgi:pimeloyl-ACP methyl ester carboxylesterase
MDPRSLLAEFRSHGSLMRIGDHQLFVSDYSPAAGQAALGLPLLFLHGFPTSSFDYVRLLPLLPQHRLILFDFLGFGYSDKPRPHTYSLFEQAELAEAVAARLGLTEVGLVAHDMGSSVALVILQRARLRVERVVLLNGSLLLSHYRPLISQRALLHPWLGPLLSRLGLIRKPVFARQFSRLFPTPPPEEELAAFWSLIAHNGGPAIYDRLIQYLNERKQHELSWLSALAAHPAPLLILWGQLDPVAVPAIGEAIFARRPDARYVKLPRLGHYPQWEDPPTIADEIRRFMQKDPLAKEGL